MCCVCKNVGVPSVLLYAKCRCAGVCFVCVSVGVPECAVVCISVVVPTCL